MSSQSLTLSSFSSRSLHLALGVIVGNFVPKLEPLSRRFCFRPTLAGAAGGSHFFFFSYQMRDSKNQKASKLYLAVGGTKSVDR